MKEGYRNPTGFRRWVKVAKSGGLVHREFRIDTKTVIVHVKSI